MFYISQLEIKFYLLTYLLTYLQGIEEALAPPNSSTVLKSLYDLLQHNVKWSWTEVQSDAFKLSKKLLQSSHYNPKLKLLLECDASPTGLGVVLSHKLENGEQKPIAFASHTLVVPSEREYAQIEKEGLSIVFGVKHFHKYLYGRHFSIVTDHKPLLGLFKEYKPVPIIQRWALLLGGYSYNLLHKPRKMHSNADALKWQSLSLDYRFLMLILLNHYMLIEFVWYLHDNKWLGSQ